MTADAHRPDGTASRTLHYAWVVAGVTFIILIVTAGIRATPGVLMVPLEAEFGWSRAAISAAVAVNIALFGLIGPFAASAMNRWGNAPADLFAVFYGLDWIATVPPTVKLTTQAFGRENTGVIYGWIGASHQLGASMAAFGAGAIRTTAGGYEPAFWTAGVLCVIAGAAFLTVGRRAFPGPRGATLAAVSA